jgi:hypothetical protein
MARHSAVSPTRLDDFLEGGEVHFALMVPQSFESSRADRLLPYLPYWPGFLADTAIWGTILPMVRLMLDAVRRGRRGPRGQRAERRCRLSATAP